MHISFRYKFRNSVRDLLELNLGLISLGSEVNVSIRRKFVLIMIAGSQREPLLFRRSELQAVLSSWTRASG